MYTFIHLFIYLQYIDWVLFTHSCIIIIIYMDKIINWTWTRMGWEKKCRGIYRWRWRWNNPTMIGWWVEGWWDQRPPLINQSTSGCFNVIFVYKYQYHDIALSSYSSVILDEC